MRALVLPVALALLAVPWSLTLPEAEAVGWCATGVPGKECWSHVVCIGMSRDHATHRERCQYSVPLDRCNAIFCPGPYLA